MLRSCFFALIFICFSSTSVSAQSGSPLDSLIAACNAYTKEDTVKVKMLLKIAGEYQKSNPNKAITAAEEAIALAQQLNQPAYHAEALNKKGYCLSLVGAYKEAISYFEKALQIFETQGLKKRAASMLSNIGTMYGIQRDAATALVYFEKAALAQKALGDKVGAARINGNMGNISINEGDYPKAIHYFDQAIQYNEQVNNPYILADLFYNKGRAYFLLADYPKAQEFYLKALAIAQKTGDKISEANYLTGISAVYHALSETTKALEYQQKALVIHEQIGNKHIIANDYINLANLHKPLKNYPAALENLQKAEALLQGVEDKEILAFCYSTLGHIYYLMTDYTKSLQYGQKALKIEEELEDLNATAFTYKEIGNIFLNAPDSVLNQMGVSAQNRFQTCERYFLKALALADSIGATQTSQSTWNALNLLYEAKGEYRKAYDAFKNYIALNDSISGEDIRKQITRQQFQYEFDKKETALKFEQQLTLEQLAQQKLLSIQQQQTLTLREQSLALSNKEADLQRLAYLKEKAEKQEKEQQLSLAEKDKQLQNVQLGALLQEKALQLKTLAEKNALIGFLIAGISAVLLAFAAFYWWIRQRQAKKEAATQAQFTRQLLENIEDDRGRIAIDLHDSVSHELLMLKQTVRKEITGPEVGNKIDNIINDIRQISRNLHPVMLDKIGLKLSLETLCEQYMQHETMYVSHEIKYENTLSKPAELQLFRIVQEGLTNALKYAKADAVKVTLRPSGTELRLDIQDNGRGFEVQKTLQGGKAFGLHSILQRAKAIGGRAEIQSQENDGTTIQVIV